MLKPEIKFQCESCHGIVLADMQDELVNCGHCSAILKVPHKLGPGVVVDDFVLLKRVGTGGMGTVYMAHQFSLERECALKILNNNYDADKHKNDFIIEARQVAKLNHLNIIKAYKVGVDNGIFFFAMEFIEGQNLKDVLRKKKTLSQEQVVKIAIEITRALGYAWKEAQLVHRDVKPDNIMLDKDGHAKLMDLGLCRNTWDTQEESDIVSGTPQYISPEQIVGETLDIRSDFYSLGATMYHLLTGKFLFNGSVDEMIDKHLEERPKPIKTYKPQINPKLDILILKLLSKKKENRFGDAETLESELLEVQNNLLKTKRAAASGSTSSNKTGLSEIAQRDSQFNRKHLIIGISVLALFLIASMITLAVGYNSKNNEEAKNETTTKKEGVGESFISDIELDAKNALTHPDLLENIPISKPLQKGLNFEYYELWNISSLKALKGLKPKASGKVLLLDLDYRKREEYFGFVFTGYLEIPYTNTYTFHLKSDDLSSLFIDDKAILEIKRYNETKEADVILKKGLHKIRIEYVQMKSGKHLTLEVSSLRFEKMKLPHEWFKREELP